jgi:hypothetical protein
MEVPSPSHIRLDMPPSKVAAKIVPLVMWKSLCAVAKSPNAIDPTGLLQKRTCLRSQLMSAFGGKADMATHSMQRRQR